MSSPPTWFFTGNTYARTRKCDWLWCLNVALPLAGVGGRQQISDTLGGDFCEWEHLKVCEDAANKQFQSQNILVKRSLVWRRESPRHSLWSFDHYSQFLFTQQKYDIKCRSHVDCVKMALLKRLPVVCRHSMRKKKSQRAVKPHFICSMRRAVGLPSTSVPLSTVCAAQTWTNCPTFSPFLLFPSPPPFLCALSLRRPSLMAFFFPCPNP